MAFKILQMEMNIGGNILMDSWKDMVNIFGLMVTHIKVIISKDTKMVMEYLGKLQINKYIKAISS